MLIRITTQPGHHHVTAGHLQCAMFCNVQCDITLKWFAIIAAMLTDLMMPAPQGAESVKTSNLDARFLFVSPPSLEALEARLRGRGTETEATCQRILFDHTL